MSRMIRRALAAAVALAALALGGSAFVQARSGGDDSDHPAAGAEAAKASQAALKITAGGEVNAVERDGENGATWEVEVTKPDGKAVDVRLDESYGLVIVESDSEDADENR